MSDPTPQEYAEALGLRSGLDAGPSKILTNDEMGPSHKLTALLEARNIDLPLSDEFLHELASVYLPSLLRTFFLNPLDIDQNNLDCWNLLIQLVLELIFQPGHVIRHFQRFVRTRPKETVDFFHIQCCRLVQVVNEPSTRSFFRPLFKITHSLSGKLGFVLGFSKLQSLFSKATSPLPSLASFELLRSRIDPVQIDIFDHTTQLLCIRHTPKKPIFQAANVGRSQEPQTSWTCHARASWEVAELGVCVEFAKGKEMPECARCKSVRYCSRKHQKKDWKGHKPSCFPPGW